MTQHHREGELTEIPLGAPTAEQPAGPAKKIKISGRTVLNIILALVVVTAVAIGVASAAGVNFSANKKENDNAVDSNALETNDAELSKDTLPEPTDGPISEIADGPECLSQDAFDVRGDGTLLMRSGINAQENTVTVELEYAGEAWLGFAFSESAAMVPNTAIIGLPTANTVGKYSLESKSVDGVNPLNERQTLTATSISQSGGITTLQFTKPLVEENEVSISGAGDIRFNWAIGSSNDLGFHAARGSSVAPFAACLPNDDEKDVVETEATTSAPTIRLATEAPTTSPTVGLVTDAPTAAATTTSPTSSPTNIPTSTPTNSPEISTLAPSIASPTADPSLIADLVYSKVGNRRACSIDACPSSPGWGVLENGCSCEEGLDRCYWDGPATTIEYFSDVTLQETSVQGLWKLAATGDQLSLGEGGDFASGSDCFDDELRGGFRVDLTGTVFVLSPQSSVTVSGYSPVMQMTTTRAGNSAEATEQVRQWGEDAELNLWIPEGAQVVDVKCGGWPAYCTSELYVVRAGGYY